MDAAALTRPATARPERRQTLCVDDTTLAFHASGGPLVAVYGLVGGAGSSTVAYLLARRAARHSTVPVLLAELDEHAGLAAVVGAAGVMGVRELARAVEEDRVPARPFAELSGGLRLLTSPSPGQRGSVSASSVARVLSDARELHGLVVVDAGTLPGSEALDIVRLATHVLYVMSASAVALRRAKLLAIDGTFERGAGRATALVAVATQPSHRVPIKQLRDFADAHVDRLLLVPHLDELARGRHRQADPRLEDTFAALATLLRRAR